MIRRRSVIMFLGAGVVPILTGAGDAQDNDRIRRVGLLLGRARTDVEGQQQAKAFEQALSSLGWSHSKVQLEYRWAAADADRLQPLARELVALRPDAIVVQTTPMVAAVLRETREIPVVFIAVTDPIASGFVASLSRPGGNATGLVDMEPSLGAKWVEVLKQITPRLVRIGYLCITNRRSLLGYRGGCQSYSGRI